MSDKITKNYKVAATGILSIDGERICISVEDKGDIALDALLRDFNNKAIRLNCSYDEEYVAKEEVDDIDLETGEILE